MMAKFSKSLDFALLGLRVAWREERNFKIELLCALLAIILGLLARLSFIEFALIIITIIIVLAVEILNTALEELCDKFSPTVDPHIAKIKDLAAAAVLVSSIGAILVALLIFGPRILALDKTLEAWLADHRSIPLLTLFNYITMLGNSIFFIVLTAIIALLLFIKKQKQALMGILVTMFGTGASIFVIKELVARARPEILHPFVAESSYSFPSGHAALSLAFYSFLMYLACQYLPRGRARKSIAYLALILILAIGASRLYLGVHFLSDVLAGWLTGLVWLWIGTLVASKMSTR